VSVSYDPLHQSGDAPQFPAPLDTEVRLIRAYLDKVATANIHDHTAMVKAATGLDHRVRSLLAALDAERGERR
jgi:hypothetical protein